MNLRTLLAIVGATLVLVGVKLQMNSLQHNIASLRSGTTLDNSGIRAAIVDVRSELNKQRLVLEELSASRSKVSSSNNNNNNNNIGAAAHLLLQTRIDKLDKALQQLSNKPLSADDVSATARKLVESSIGELRVALDASVQVASNELGSRITAIERAAKARNDVATIAELSTQINLVKAQVDALRSDVGDAKRIIALVAARGITPEDAVEKSIRFVIFDWLLVWLFCVTRIMFSLSLSLVRSRNSHYTRTTLLALRKISRGCRATKNVLCALCRREFTTSAW